MRCNCSTAGREALRRRSSSAGSSPDRRIVDAFRLRHPDTPIIGFPKGAGGKLRAYAAETGVDAIGLDETVDPVGARELPRACRCRAISTRSR
jgi:uroporphyrinogen-III decarboxylase